MVHTDHKHLLLLFCAGSNPPPRIERMVFVYLFQYFVDSPKAFIPIKGVSKRERMR